MKLTADSTTKIVTLQMDTSNGVPARIWEAVTERGVRCHLYVTRVAVANGEDHSEFEAELEEHAAPSAEIEEIPLRLIL